MGRYSRAQLPKRSTRDATADTFAGDCLGTAFEFIYNSTGFPVG